MDRLVSHLSPIDLNWNGNIISTRLLVIYGEWVVWIHHLRRVKLRKVGRRRMLRMRTSCRAKRRDFRRIRLYKSGKQEENKGSVDDMYLRLSCEKIEEMNILNLTRAISADHFFLYISSVTLSFYSSARR